MLVSISPELTAFLGKFILDFPTGGWLKRALLARPIAEQRALEFGSFLPVNLMNADCTAFDGGAKVPHKSHLDQHNYYYEVVCLQYSSSCPAIHLLFSLGKQQHLNPLFPSEGKYTHKPFFSLWFWPSFYLLLFLFH